MALRITKNKDEANIFMKDSKYFTSVDIVAISIFSRVFNNPTIYRGYNSGESVYSKLYFLDSDLANKSNYISKVWNTYGPFITRDSKDPGKLNSLISNKLFNKKLLEALTDLRFDLSSDKALLLSVKMYNLYLDSIIDNAKESFENLKY